MSTVQDIPVIEFVQPLPGFPGFTRFALVQLDDTGLLCTLQSIDDPALSFLVASPVTFFPEYAPVVDEETVAALSIEDAAQVLVLLVLTTGATVAETTANLLAPVLVNTVSQQAVQVILNDPELSVAAPLVG